MPIEIQLSTLQLKQIAKAISLNDIKEYIENHKTEYEEYLREYENNGQDSTTKQYLYFEILQKVYKLNVKKKYKTFPCMIWKEYTEEEKSK